MKTKAKCSHCRDMRANGIIVSAGGLFASFCDSCGDKWWKLRDKLVGEAFASYLRPQDRAS